MIRRGKTGATQAMDLRTRGPISCIAALLLTGCYDSSFRSKNGGPPAEPVTSTIALFNAAHTGTTFRVTGDVVLSGIVTTSGEGGNFYRTLCIEDEGAGLEVMAGIDQLHNDYPVGSRITLHLKGLAAGRSRGVVQIGRLPAPGSGYATDYIGSKPALDAALTRSGEPLQAVEPSPLTLGELTPARCGSLVRIDGLRYAPEDLTLGTWAGEKRFTDGEGREIRTFVRNYARFADEEVPSGPGSLTGILQQDDKGRYLLKPRDENDLPH